MRTRAGPLELPGAEPGPAPSVSLGRLPAGQGAVHLGGPPAEPRTLLDIVVATARRFPDAAAIDDGRGALDYRGLLAEVGALRGELVGRGVGGGDRVGVRVASGTAELYVAILAVLSVGAAYVPVDVDDPPERAELVWFESRVCAVVGDGCWVADGAVPPGGAGARCPGPGDDAWVIFTSGSTGTPKGVAVTHRSAAAFVDAEACLFLRGRPLGPGDRVLAGLSVAFDASCEEMWLAWRHGACLVPAPRALVRSGAELGDWLGDQRITVVSTVPTLAALWSVEQLGGVRLLILGGEACPEHLAHRLAGACVEVWNTYGPTEATVVSCAARLTPDGPVRIGLPLAGWQLAVVDPRGHPVAAGEVGELVIAGVGTARYVDPRKDAERFVGLSALGWPRAYRSGDLVRAGVEGLSYVGRADAQVKIRGYRVEPSEIEAALLQCPGITQAVVSTYQPDPQTTELVGYYSTHPASTVDPDELVARLRAGLPAYMVPAFLDELAVIPTQTSGKADRSRLPAPRARRGARKPGAAPPATPTEATLCGVLAEVLGVDAVGVESHIFDDLGASSLLMARLCARAREIDGLPPVAMRQVYAHPTVRGLAAALDEGAPATPVPSPPAAAPLVGAGPGGPGARGRWAHLVCGTAQLLALTALLGVGTLVVGVAVEWTARATGAVQLGERAVAAAASVLVVLCVAPIAAKWLLVGRWQPAAVAVWSPGHLRFWVAATLIRANPLALFAGSPLYLLYLRALGARIGRGAVIFSRTVPVCTDLLTVGRGAVIGKRCSFTGYRVDAGVLRTGAITVGHGAVIGDSSVLEIDTAVGDRAQLAHASSLHSGQTVPEDARWHGSPAEPAPPPKCPTWTPHAVCSRARRLVFGTAQLLNLFVGAPLALTVLALIVKRLPEIPGLVLPGAAALGTGGLYLREMVFSAALFAAAVVLGLVVVTAVPALARITVRPGRIYPLYGFAYWCHRVVARVSGSPFFVQLFGDSSYIIGYLRAIGYRATKVGQTGSNFGAQLTHETPFLVSVGAATMVSDGVVFQTAQFSNTAFRTRPVAVGARSFLGNAICLPPGAALGDGCFVGTKTMIPADGAPQSDVGLLGSPPFEIPRARNADAQFNLTRTELRQRLTGKNRHNLATMALFLGAQWLRMYIGMVIAVGAINLVPVDGNLALVVGAVLLAGAEFALGFVLERASTSFRPLRAQYCSIYEPYFWWHERTWKFSTQPHVFNGTPMKPLALRLLGVRVGRRVFDDGASLSEKSLVHIGDEVTLNAGTVLQAHSMEDGIFKSDRIVVGNRCTLGTGSFVHYGTTLGDGTSLGSDAFLMKGQTAPAGSHWRGNPAQEVATANTRDEANTGRAQPPGDRAASGGALPA